MQTPNTLNITVGTDVILNVTLEHDGVVLNPALIDNLQANLITGLGRKTPIETSIGIGYIVVNIPWVDGRLPGCYSLEITGSINDLAWSAVGKSIIRYTSATEIGHSTVDVSGDLYDVVMEVGYYFTDSPIEGVNVTVDNKVGTPKVDYSYIHKVLSMDFKNLKGERGNGIASSSETLSPDDGGTNTHIFIDNDGNEHIFHTINGHEGKQGATVHYDAATDIVLDTKTGDSEIMGMTQKAVTKELTYDIIPIPLTAANAASDDYGDDGSKWTDASSTNYGLIFQVTPGAWYKWERGSVSSCVVWLQDLNITVGSAVTPEWWNDDPSATATYHPQIFQAPNDAHYIYFRIKRSGNDYTPSFFGILQSVKEKVEEIAEDVALGLKSEHSHTLVHFGVVSGQRTPSGTKGISEVTAAATRATADMFFPIDVIREYHHIIVPNGYKVAIIGAKKSSKDTSSSAFITSGWINSQTPEISPWLNDTYKYVCLNYKKDDDSNFTSAEIAALSAGSYLSKNLGTSILDSEGNTVGDGVDVIKVEKEASSMSCVIRKGYYLNVGQGAFIAGSARACIQQLFPTSFFKMYNKITVPTGYDFSVCSVMNLSDGVANTNTDLQYLVDGWNAGDGNPYTIGKSLADNLPYVGINFKRHDNADVTNADIAALAAGVTLSSDASEKGFLSLKVLDFGGNVLGGIINPNGNVELEVLDKNAIETLTGCIGDNTYNGERIVLRQQSHSFDRRLFNTLPSASFAQSFAIYGDYMLRFMYSGSTLTASLYNVATNTFIRNINLPYAPLAIPHCNTACFGRVFAEGNNDLPLLYLSQWNEERGCLVYDIHLDGTASLVQTIVSDVDASKFGAGQADWVVDYDQGYIYSIAYKIANGYDKTEAEGNRQMICKFRLPQLTDGEAITLGNADIVDCYDIPPTCVMQDKCYRNGRIIIAAGGGSSSDSSWNRIYSLNLGGRRVEASIPISSFLNKEPECVDMYGNLLIMEYNQNTANKNGELYAYEF